MSLFSLNCRCANSVPRMKNFLRECGYPEWNTIKMAKGRSECLEFISTLPHHQTDKELDKLRLYIKRQSSWSIILGTDGTHYHWADLGHSQLKEKLDAEIIVKEYGNV